MQSIPNYNWIETCHAQILEVFFGLVMNLIAPASVQIPILFQIFDELLIHILQNIDYPSMLQKNEFWSSLMIL